MRQGRAGQGRAASALGRIIRTFLGARRAEPEPCDERTDDDSSDMALGDASAADGRRRCEEVGCEQVGVDARVSQRARG